MLAANGVKVAVNARSQEGIDTIVEELRGEGAEAIGIAADVGELAEVERVRDQVESDLGPIDILLPYAGGFGAFTPIEETTEAEWREVIDWNLTSTFLAVRAVIPGMIEREEGAIVTMASNGGRYLDKLLTASYAAAKAGVVQFTRHVAKELGPHNIRVNSIAPATVTSERVERIMDDEALREGRRDVSAGPDRHSRGLRSRDPLPRLRLGGLADRHHARRRRRPDHALVAQADGSGPRFPADSKRRAGFSDRIAVFSAASSSWSASTHPGPPSPRIILAG